MEKAQQGRGFSGGGKPDSLCLEEVGRRVVLDGEQHVVREVQHVNHLVASLQKENVSKREEVKCRWRLSCATKRRRSHPAHSMQ